jgi:hypothetical protein
MHERSNDHMSPRVRSSWMLMLSLCLSAVAQDAAAFPMPAWENDTPVIGCSRRSPIWWKRHCVVPYRAHEKTIRDTVMHLLVDLLHRESASPQSGRYMAHHDFLKCDGQKIRVCGGESSLHVRA